jgi:hypothetical protein
MDFTIIALLIALILTQILMHLERTVWRKERQNLLDRIQSGTMADYKRFTEKTSDTDGKKADREHIEYL